MHAFVKVYSAGTYLRRIPPNTLCHPPKYKPHKQWIYSVITSPGLQTKLHLSSRGFTKSCQPAVPISHSSDNAEPTILLHTPSVFPNASSLLGPSQLLWELYLWSTTAAFAIAQLTDSMAPSKSSLAGSLASVLLLAAGVNAQASAYGQCGGQNWTGATTCVSGWTCVYQNAYYSQCLQVTTTGTTTTTTTTTTPKTSTTTSSSSSKTSSTTTTSKSSSTTTTTTTTKSSTTTSTTTSKSSTTTTSTTTSSSATSSSTSGPSRLVGKTPVLGWNSWNAYGGDINEAKIIAAANNISSMGLKALGYSYVAIDDTWSNITGRDPTTQRVKPDSNKFPNGIKYVADAVHALGLNFGIYSDAGLTTCAGYPGSLYYETIDAQTWNDWGVDLIKYDNCNVPSNWTDSYNIPSDYDWYNSNSAQRYKRLTDALNTVSRPIVYSICNWGNANVWTWGARVGHQWRLSGDSSASWSYITSIIQQAVYYISYVDFYAHGDMDMMEIGNGGLTLTEERTHFAAWCFLKSPILLGTDLSKLTSDELTIIKNKELLAFSQDTTYGAAAKPYVSGTPTYFSGTSTAGAHVFMINYNSTAGSMTVNFTAVPELSSKTSWKVHDMWTGTDIGTYSGSYTTTVASHDTAALRFT